MFSRRKDQDIKRTTTEKEQDTNKTFKRAVKIQFSMCVHMILAEMSQESTSVFTVLAKL